MKHNDLMQEFSDFRKKLKTEMCNTDLSKSPDKK